MSQGARAVVVARSDALARVRIMFGGRLAWVIAFVVLALLTPGSAVIPAVAAPGDEPLPESLLVIHDSVLRDSRPQIADALPGVDLRYIGWPGLRVEAAVGLVKDNRELIGDKAIIELGYNYVKRPDRDLFRADIDALMDELSGVEHVIWMSVTEFEPRMEIVNKELRLATHRWPNLQIAEWHPVTAGDSSLTHDDGYHLNRNGAVVFATFLHDHLTDPSLWNTLPVGRFRIARARKDFKVTGWAFDPELGKPARVRIVVDGKVAKRVTAKRSRESISRRVGAAHGVGIETRLKLTRGGHIVCIDVSNFDGLRPVRLQCRAVVVG